MKIALIGASGQLAQDIQKIIPLKFLVNFDYPDFDITKMSNVKSQMSKVKPDMIINTAAYNLVDSAEEHPDEALAVNYHGVENLVDVCFGLNIPLVHFSSDYVFGQDKSRSKPYTENDQPAPINEYGQSKLLGEQVMQKKLKKYFLIRTSYLFGQAGSQGKGGNLVESLIAQARQEPELKVIDDQIITPTYCLDLAKQVWKLIQTKYYGLFHASSEGHCTIYELAKEIFKYMDLSIKLVPVKFKNYKLPAKRPRYSVLENKRLKELGLNIMRPWQVTIPDYLKEKGYINS
jgi:dTDP-4-dehydrorhamnose reductase